MIWTVVFMLIGYMLFRFVSSLIKDQDELQNQTLESKFNFIVSQINNSAFGGLGSVTVLDQREFNLYQEGQNQIIKFHYSSGHLTITWKYKYYQKEVIHERQFNDVRNLSLFDQQKIADQMIREMQLVIEEHKADVLS